MGYGMIFDYIAASSLITGYVLIGKKKKLGWLFSCAGNMLYIGVSIITGLYGMGMLSTVMTIITLINYDKWSNENKRGKQTK